MEWEKLDDDLILRIPKSLYRLSAEGRTSLSKLSHLTIQEKVSIAFRTSLLWIDYPIFAI
ncbi:MAG: hypothetical protein RMK98_05310 [Bacteroidia bacterium]|nr:hypothetical protein [Bacteroidia bacterium]